MVLGYILTLLASTPSTGLSYRSSSHCGRNSISRIQSCLLEISQASWFGISRPHGSLMVKTMSPPSDCLHPLSLPRCILVVCSQINL
ncbi:hypothetical protein B0H13DRAFT_2139237 [Mycena leptocephala]|nr:hypothetical protein B0H13DRAFT_2139237 [Mycena leptocephala]